jgi:hypothetical protein
MTNIIQLAIDAGAARFYPETQAVKDYAYLVGQGFLERFAELAIQAEREACAKVCEEGEFMTFGCAAQAIRARSNT